MSLKNFLVYDKYDVSHIPLRGVAVSMRPGNRRASEGLQPVGTEGYYYISKVSD